MLHELILIMNQFGGGQGDPASDAVRFLLAAFFWGVLFFVSFRLWQSTNDYRHRLFSIAATIGFTRELIMFIAEYGSFRGYIRFPIILRYYPPLEHIVAAFSVLLLGYAFLRFYFNFERFSRLYLICTSSLSIIAYLIIVPLWIRFLNVYGQTLLRDTPNSSALFHSFPGDLVFHLLDLLIITPILCSFLYARTRHIRFPWLAFVAFSFFFMDNSLHAVDDLSGDRYAYLLEPLRHCMHILAIVQLVGVYWWEATRQIKDKHQFLQSMLDTIPDLISYKNIRNEYLGCNQNFAASFLDGDQGRIVGCTDRDIFKNQDTALNSGKDDQELMATNTAVTFEHQYILGNQRREDFETIKTPFLNSDGRVAGLIGISRNITSRKRVEDELNRKNIEMEQFIYTVSHDLRSPLVTVKTFMGYLTEDLSAADTERITKDMEFISAAADRMEALLNELLDMSRIGRTALPHEETTFQHLVTEAMDSVAGQISEAGVEVQVCTRELVLHGDRHRLLQIWQNLLDNAVKYIGCQSKPCIQIGIEEEHGETVFYVNDNGIGIAPQYHEKVFGLFEQLDRQSGGVGMGLTMVRRIVELYGGWIRLESTGESQGCCFRFTLPRALSYDANAPGADCQQPCDNITVQQRD